MKRKAITRAPAAGRIAEQYAPFDERQNIAQRRVVRTFGELGVFGRCEITLKAIKEAVENKALAIIEFDSGY